MPSPVAVASLARVKVYAVGPGVKAPELLPLNLPPLSTGKCKQKADGTVMLSVIVDETGRPRNTFFFHPLGTDLDKFALQIAGADRFKPGTSSGAPVAVAQLLEVNLQGCVEQAKDEAGKKVYRLRLRSQPEQKLAPLPQPPEDTVLAPDDKARVDYEGGTPRTQHVGGAVKAPVPLISVEAQFTEAARRARYAGICMISVVVDKNGMPQNPKVLRTLDYGLDQNAVDAVMRYRFKPAMRDGEPVPVIITVEVNFQFY
jgi:TonB family protein